MIVPVPYILTPCENIFSFIKVWGWVVRCESGLGLRVGQLTPIHILDPQPIRTTHPLIKNLRTPLGTKK